MSAHRRTGATVRIVLAACSLAGRTTREISDQIGIPVPDVSRALHYLRKRGAVTSERIASRSGAHLWRRIRGARWRSCTDARAMLATLRGGPRTTPEAHAACGAARTLHATRLQLLTCEGLGWVEADRSGWPHRWSLTAAGGRAVRAWERDEEEAESARRAKR